MKPLKQIVSALTAAAMSLTLLTGILPAKAIEDPSPETGTHSDLSMTAENSLGQLMLDASQQDPSEDSGEYDGSAGVTGIVIEDGKADISYYTPVKADLVLAFYSDDEAQMYASLNAEVSPAEPADDGTPADQNQTYTFTVPTDITSYYVVKAYLIGAAFTPLCEAYSTNLYTESITKARTSKPSDYDPSLVVNLDETTDHNFLVLREETVQIAYDGEHNLLDSYDEKTGTYHFTNADAQLTSLQKGDIVYYNYNNGVDRLVLTVLDISVNGSDVTITTADMEISDAFSVVHIEETVQPELDLTPGETYENGLTYIGSHEVSEPASNSLHPLAGASEPITLVKHEFSWSSDDNLWKSKDLQQYDKDIKDIKANPDNAPTKEIPAVTFYGSIKGTAELTLKVKSVLTYELFVWEDGQLCSTVDLENSVTLSGSAAFKAVGKLFVVGFSKGLKGGIVITAGVGVEFDGGITCSTGELTLSSVASGKVWHGFLGLIKDSNIHLNNLTCDATNFLQPDLEISGFIGLFAEVGLGIHVQGFDDLGQHRIYPSKM
ncbi:MAG: hypothetical protein K5695_03040 [Oscillospiraceae bacterium]|nr:hypothetical protein [Oscillospiraceae bacterium]